MATTKILYAITKGNEGGAQRYLYDLVRSLPRDRYEPLVLIGGDSGSWLHKACTALEVRSVTARSIGRDVSPGSDLASFFEFVNLFRRELPFVVHLNSSKIGFVGALAARLAGVPRIIFTAHGWAFKEKRGFLMRAIFWLGHAATMLLADVTIANSRATAREAPLKKGLVTIPLGIEPPAFLSREEARTRLGVDGTIYGTIAELHRSKGLDVLIDAVPSMVHTAHVVIIGEGEKRAALIARITAKKLKDRVTLVGHKENAAQYLKALAIFVLPSRTESAGYVILEAGLAGLPVVATSVGGIPEIIEDGVTGLLVPPENPTALAEAIEKLCADTILRQKLGAALKQKVERDFPLDLMVLRTVTLYES